MLCFTIHVVPRPSNSPTSGGDSSAPTSEGPHDADSSGPSSNAQKKSLSSTSEYLQPIMFTYDPLMFPILMQVPQIFSYHPRCEKGVDLRELTRRLLVYPRNLGGTGTSQCAS